MFGFIVLWLLWRCWDIGCCAFCWRQSKQQQMVKSSMRLECLVDYCDFLYFLCRCISVLTLLYYKRQIDISLKYSKYPMISDHSCVAVDLHFVCSVFLSDEKASDDWKFSMKAGNTCTLRMVAQGKSIKTVRRCGKKSSSTVYLNVGDRQTYPPQRDPLIKRATSLRGVIYIAILYSSYTCYTLLYACELYIF